MYRCTVLVVVCGALVGALGCGGKSEDAPSDAGDAGDARDAASELDGSSDSGAAYDGSFDVDAATGCPPGAPAEGASCSGAHDCTFPTYACGGITRV